MRIALVCDWFAPRVGGIESYLIDLATQLRAAGHAPEVITATPGPSTVSGLPVHRLPLSLLPGWDVAWRPAPTVERLRRLLYRFDVVHGHSLYSPLAHASMKTARELGVPGVLSSHSLLSPSGVLALSLWNRAQAWAGWPTVLTAVSTLAAAELRVASGREHVHVVANGFNRPPAVAQPARGDRRPTVISVMRLRRRKQPCRLVRAIPRIDAQLAPELRPRIVVVGDGPERERVERLLRRLGLERRVELTGSLTRPEVMKELARADVFALPTLREAFGIAILEARAAGLPIVAMRGNGAGDLVQHGREGLLAGSTDEWADQVALLCRDADLRARLAGAARADLEPFLWPAVLARHLEIYALARGAEVDVLQEAA
jgi:glycosyltransferase involved in cell wall biosynthesis